MITTTNMLVQRALNNGPEFLTGPTPSGKKLVLNKNGEPLRILMIGSHFCIRIIKEALALKKRGYTVDAFAGKISYGLEFFDRVYMFMQQNGGGEPGVRQFNGMLDIIKDKYDIFHYHNEPDWPAVALKEKGVGPIVFDAHDLDSVRQNVVPLDEVLAYRAADGVVHVSKPVHDWACKLHNYTKPTTILFSHCNDHSVFYNERDLNRTGIVYEGGANRPQEYLGAFEYRDLYSLMKKLVDVGNDVTMYIGNIDAVPDYMEIGVKVFPPTIYPEMMRGLTNHRWGWCGFNNPRGDQRQVDLTLTNKMWEYIAAGCPVLVYGASETSRLVEELGVGVTISNLDELGNVDKTFGHLYPQFKANVEVIRRKCTMEQNIYKVENLYREVLKNCGHID